MSQEQKEQYKPNALDIQVGGDHYKKLGAYQPLEVLAKWILVKYLLELFPQAKSWTAAEALSAIAKLRRLK